MKDEEQFFDIWLVTNYCLAWREYLAVHVDDELVDEATLTPREEMAEVVFELFECFGTLNQVCLHIRSDLLIEVKFFNY